MSKRSHCAWRSLALAFLAGCMLVSAAGFSRAESARARVNYEYQLIEPQRVTSGERIEVIEFFWYGCPYCYQFQAPIESWIKRKPKDVELRRVPAIFRESWVPHARLYYTLEALGEADRLHQAVYHAYHVEGENLNTGSRTADWAARHGIDRARWLAAYESAEVARKIERARSDTRAYAIHGTPSLVVDGRYVTSSRMSASIPGVIPILEDLIVVARERRASK